MATGCELTRGRGLGGCLTTVGGVKRVYLCEFAPATTGSSANDSVMDIFSGITNVYQYDMKRGAGSLAETVNASAEAGTVFYTPVTTVKLGKLSVADQNELKLIAQNTLLVFVELNETHANGNNMIFATGTDNGCVISGGTNSAGAAMGDFNGYEWTFEANQGYPMWMLEDYSAGGVPFDNFPAVTVV
tara:strand:+ start:1388 stop:1951 length:564 start_codon:yes stop_codon:yes gene_type:complete